MAFDTYIEFVDAADLKGEAIGMKDAVEIYSFSWGASAPVTIGPGTGGAAASRVSISSFNIMKKTDATSAALFLNCCKGTHITQVKVHMRKQTGEGGQQDFLTYTFDTVFVESIQWSGSSGGDDTPTESVSLAFAKVQIEYKKQDDKGGLVAAGDVSWDLQKLMKK